jgi:hypothetical protein
MNVANEDFACGKCGKDWSDFEGADQYLEQGLCPLCNCESSGDTVAHIFGWCLECDNRDDCPRWLTYKEELARSAHYEYLVEYARERELQPTI